LKTIKENNVEKIEEMKKSMQHAIEEKNNHKYQSEYEINKLVKNFN